MAMFTISIYLPCALWWLSVVSLWSEVCAHLDYIAPDPKLRFNTTELLLDAGYPVERFTVTTDDGYILPLFRIADGKVTRNSRPPVLLQHGMMVASDSWLLQGPGKDIAYLMYDAGYDVWMGDFRGNAYTRNHITLSPKDPVFWQFSFHEHGIYDLPAMLELILKITGYEQLSYVSHSMSTTAFFVMGSERPHLMSKIKLFVGMSPIGAWNPANISPQKKRLFEFAAQAAAAYKSQNTFEVFPRTWFAPVLSRLFCDESSPTQFLCYDLGFFWAGSRAHRISRKVLPLVLSHAPAGLSLYQPVHYLQLMKGIFGPFDYGPRINQRKYGTTRPSLYDLSRVTCPVSLHFSPGDFIVNVTDVRENMRRMPNVVDVQEYPDLNHVDFIWGRTAYKQVYPRVIDILDRYHNSPIR